MDEIMSPKTYQIQVVAKKEGHVVLNQDFTEFPIVFGRSKDCHLSFPENSFLSRIHGSLTYFQNQLILEDSGSRNGILVNQVAINGPVKISSPAQFTAGQLDFFVTLKVQEMTVDPTEEVTQRTTIEELAAAEKTAEKVFVLPPRVASSLASASESSEFAPGQATVISNRLIKISRDLRLEDNSDLKNAPGHDLTLQGVVTWGDDIFDVRQFRNQDYITVGGAAADAVYVPFLQKKIKLGLVFDNKGYLSIPKHIHWRLDRKGYSFSPAESLENKIAKEKGANIQVPLTLNDLCTLDLGDDVSLHFRYVRVPRPLIARSWLENREEIKKAISISVVIHIFVAGLAMLSAPKSKAPEIQNIPPRFAKLLVEPPKMILAPPPELPKPEPIAEVKPEPIPEPVVERKISPKKVIAKKKVPEKVEKIVQVKKNPNPVPVAVTKPQPLKPAVPSVEDSFANAFASAPSAKTDKMANNPIKINKDLERAGPAGGGIGKSLSGTLKSKVGEMNSGAGGGSGGGLGNSVGAGVGQVNYAMSGGTSAQVGKRGIASAVLGTPKLKDSDILQGLSQTEVMNEVNKHLAEIRRCYERALFQDTNISGRVEYEWNINPKGVVSNAQVTRSGVSNGEFLNSCVISIIKKMKFPNSKNGQPTVTNIGFPFGKE